MLKLKLQYFGHLIQRLTHRKRPWCWERWMAGGEGDDRGWDGWMASPTQWTWVWASSRRWRTGKPGVLQSTVKKRHDWATEKQKSTNSWRLITLSKHHTRLSSYKKKKKIVIMSQMDFSPEQDWMKILSPLGAFIKPFLFQNWTLKKRENLEPLT